MLWLYRFICGYVHIEFSGNFSEKILNLCAKNRISLWNSKCVKRKIICCITVKDFFLLPQIMKGSKIRLHIIKKCGLPFYLKRYKKRVGFFTGIIIFFVFLKFMSCFVWSIEVTGNHRIPSHDILEACNSIGIYEGILKNKINPNTHKQKLLLNMDKLAWASLNIEGCKLTVNVTEVKEKADDNKIPSNLKANADGTIKKVDITSGNCVVKVGDTVKKGDVLVSGILEKADETQFVHSIGSVIAKTERSVTVSGTYEKEIVRYSGRSKKKRVLNFFGLKIPLYLGKEKGDYSEKLKCMDLELFEKKLPICLYTKEFFFNEKVIHKLSREQLENDLDSVAENELKESGVDNFEVISRTVNEINDGLQITFVVSAQEDIAYQDILLFSSGN